MQFKQQKDLYRLHHYVSNYDEINELCLQFKRKKERRREREKMYLLYIKMRLV